MVGARNKKIDDLLDEERVPDNLELLKTAKNPGFLRLYVYLYKCKQKGNLTQSRERIERVCQLENFEFYNFIKKLKKYKMFTIRMKHKQYYNVMLHANFIFDEELIDKMLEQIK